MSLADSKDVVIRRDEALKNFEYLDAQATEVGAPGVFKLKPLNVTSAIIVIGYVPLDATRFSINLKCKAPGTIALHLNPRLDRGYVVRNSKIKGCWEQEETCSPVSSRGYIFRRNFFFHLTIFCALNEFQVAIDGEHFCAFAYRLPLEEIVGLEFNDDIEEIKVRQTNISVYPDPQIWKPSRILKLIDDAPLDKDLDLPVIIDLPKGFNVGATLLIQGRLKLLPYSFYINLQKGKLIYPHPIIAMHLNPRYHYGNQPACMVMNSWNNGSWDVEERHQGQNWMPGRGFLLTICCTHEGFEISLSNKMIGEFKHRLQPSVIDTVCITGDLVINQMSVSY